MQGLVAFGGASAANRGATWEGEGVQSHSEPPRSVLCSGWISLECHKCGEMLVLIGREEDWRSERRAGFECECGGKLTLEDNRVGVPIGSPAAT